VKAERWFVLVGGINGAGKTTLAQSRSFLQIFGVDPGAPIEIINPDLVTQRIREQAPTLRLDEVNLRAARVCESRVRAALKEREASVVIAHRVRHGGHAVSAKKIRKRWPRSLANAPWFWAHADHAIVVFNGWSPGARPLLMAWKTDDEAWFLEGAPGPSLIADLKAAR
jgi:predicted ABC-type ATPase